MNSQSPTRGARQEFLLIDISNSFTKLTFSSREKIGKVHKLPTAELDSTTLNHLLGQRDFRVAVISSVVPKMEKSLSQFFHNRRILRVTPRLKLGVGIDYPKPASIGADRLANAAAVVALYRAPAVVVDFGTAVTFDIISSERKYLGGVIAPGLEVMTDYLFQRTALLPKINLQEPVSAIGKTTRGAMLAGAVFGYRGLVREILAEIKRELSVKNLQVIATGGYAELIAAKMPQIQIVHPNLTLEGLRIIGIFNS